MLVHEVDLRAVSDFYKGNQSDCKMMPNRNRLSYRRERYIDRLDNLLSKVLRTYHLYTQLKILSHPQVVVK